MNIEKYLKWSAIPLIAGFFYLIFTVTFASFLSGSLRALSWYTAEMFVGIVAGIVVIELGAFYLRSQMCLQTSRMSALKKLARNVVVTFFVGPFRGTDRNLPLYSVVRNESRARHFWCGEFSDGSNFWTELHTSKSSGCLDTRSVSNLFLGIICRSVSL